MVALPGNSSLRFSLNSADGRRVLALRPHLLWELVAVERLELEIPSQAGDPPPTEDATAAPGTAAADALLARWQTRRCRLVRSRLSIDGERLERWIGTRRLADHGLSDVSLRIADGLAVIAFTARVGDREAFMTIRARMVPIGGQQVLITFDEVRCYGHLGVPPLRVAMMLGEAVLGRPDADDVLAPALVGVSGLRLAPLGRTLWDTLPPGGWRLPSYRHARLEAVRLLEGRIEMDFGGGAGARPVAAASLAVPPGDELLAHNELEPALLAYRAGLAMTGVSVELQERILGLLTVSVETWEEASRMGLEMMRSAERRPKVAARLVLAELAAEQGDLAGAAGLYAELADDAERADEAEDADGAALRAAELELAVGTPQALAQATGLLERVVARRLHPRAASMLANRYTAEGRWDDLAQLERRWVAEAFDAMHEAQARLRLAHIYLERLGEPGRAREELERAARIYPVDAELWLMLAEARRATGDRGGALRALDRALELGDEGQRAAAEALRPAILAEASVDEEPPSEPERGELDLAAQDRHGEEDQAEASYEAMLAVRPDDARALEALADLSYRRRDLVRARDLYARLAVLPEAVHVADLWRRRGELAEAEGTNDEAERHYRRAIERDPNDSAAHEALARLALRRDDPASLYNALKAILDNLPLDAVDRITELRQRLGDLAQRLGYHSASRTYYELVLAQRPDSVEALTPLADLYGIEGDWEQCAEALGRLSYLSTVPRQRATMLFRQAEVYRLYLGQHDKASSGYLKAADIDPTHQPTLRRLVAYYYSSFDSKSMREVIDELESHGTPLEDVTAMAGMGFALAGESARAGRYLAAADVAGLAVALGTLQVREPAAMDRPLEIALEAIAQAQAGMDAIQAAQTPVPAEQLAGALDQRLASDPSDLGGRLARSRLAEQMGDHGRAELHYSVLAFVDPEGPVARHLATLPEVPLPVPEPPVRSDPLRSALGVLGPLVLGAVPPTDGADPLAEWSQEMSPYFAHFGFPDASCAVSDELGEPAWAEPTAPPRILVRRDMLEDGAAAQFAVVRALVLLHSGASLVQGRMPEDVGGLLMAASCVIGGNTPTPMPYVSTWLGALRSIGVDRRSVPVDRLVAAKLLAEAGRFEDLADRLDAFLTTERLAADRAALTLTGDIMAALRALTPVGEGAPPRARSLATAAELRAFVELVTG